MAAIAASEQAIHNTYAGIYVMDLGNEAGGVLTVIQASDSKLKFDLDCTRGVPSYNSGAIQGTITVIDAKATFRTTKYGGKCEINFNFTEDGVYISQIGSDFDCGFGYGVYCNGKYYLESLPQQNRRTK